jgi:hypothetical protein
MSMIKMDILILNAIRIVYLLKGLNISKGKQIQLIDCTCGFEWLEMWVLPNWLWLKSPSPYNHWTSVIWDEE